MKRMYNVKLLKICGIFATIVVIMYFYFYFFKHEVVRGHREYKKQSDSNKYVIENIQQLEFHEREPEVFDGEKIVHLDLKGAPPKVSYYEKLFPLLADLGANGVLIEYEDMFPYSGNLLENTSALNAYTLNDIATINNLAKNHHLKVIPLVQTFGHMEFILKLSQFKEYREVISYPQVICPSHENTLNLLMDMIEQVVSAHPNSNMLHIGLDEVFHIGLCSKCTRKMYNENLTKGKLFLKHAQSIIKSIKRKYPHLKILMWDDQFRSLTQKEIEDKISINEVEPVVWKYTKDVYEELGPSLWDMYSQLFPNLWIASAFKGATGSNRFVCDITHYLQNHRSWMSVISEYKDHIKFQGIIITGWQRYDHFAVLCELLPVGIPSLAMSLRLLRGHNDSPFSPPKEVAKFLKCEQPYALMGPAFGSPKCSYPGGDILEIILQFQQLKQEYDAVMEDSRVVGWMTSYNVDNSFSSPQYVESVTAPLGRIKAELHEIERDLTSALSEVYDNFTIREYIETYIKPFEKQVMEIWNAKEVLLSKDSWPRRPLNAAGEL